MSYTLLREEKEERGKKNELLGRSRPPANHPQECWPPEKKPPKRCRLGEGGGGKKKGTKRERRKNRRKDHCARAQPVLMGEGRSKQKTGTHWYDAPGFQKGGGRDSRRCGPFVRFLGMGKRLEGQRGQALGGAPPSRCWGGGGRGRKN